jgi:hypothetical protein
MRSRALVFALLGPVAILTGCDVFSPDNYDEPTARLTGQVTYQGQPVPVATGEVELDLWQPDYELDEEIDVTVDQDGTFSAVLFDGSYEINLVNGQGPWVDDPTRIPFEIRGDMTLEIPVTPYYIVENANLVNNNDVIEATFHIGQVDASRPVEYVGLYVSTTTFVDRTNRIRSVEMDAAAIPDLAGTISLSIALPDDIRLAPGSAPREAVFARVGIKTVGVSDMVFSQVQKIGL